MNIYEQYSSKLVPVEEAVLSIQSGETVAFAQLGSCPSAICEHMTLLKGHATNVHTYLPVTTRNYPFMCDPEYKETFDYTCGILMPCTRKGYQNGMVSPYPNDLHSGIDRWLEVNGDDVFITAVAPMDEHGYFCMPLSLIYERNFFERVKRVIVEVNPRLPRVWGQPLRCCLRATPQKKRKSSEAMWPAWSRMETLFSLVGAAFPTRRPMPC